MKLKYTGNGSNIINVPAHDLDEQEIEALAQDARIPVAEYIKVLTARGIFSVMKPPHKPKPKADSEKSEES